MSNENEFSHMDSFYNQTMRYEQTVYLSLQVIIALLDIYNQIKIPLRRSSR